MLASCGPPYLWQWSFPTAMDRIPKTRREGRDATLSGVWGHWGCTSWLCLFQAGCRASCRAGYPARQRFLGTPLACYQIVVGTKLWCIPSGYQVVVQGTLHSNGALHDNLHDNVPEKIDDNSAVYIFYHFGFESQPFAILPEVLNMCNHGLINKGARFVRPSC